jgi:hypothetical protein
MSSWAAVLIILFIGVISCIFWLWFWFSYLPKSAIQDYEPDDDQEKNLTGQILMEQGYKSGLFKEQHVLYFIIRHSYWLVRDEETGINLAVLVNLRKKQFGNAANEFQVGDRVRITGGYLKRNYGDEAAIKILELADSPGVDVHEKETRALLRFLGVTTTYSPYRHPFGLGLKKDSVEKMQPTGVMLVAEEIEKVNQ